MIQTLPSMYKSMYLQIFQFLEPFITHTTSISRLSSMYTLMYFQTSCLTESFITLITTIWTLPSMYTLMYIQITCFTECFITHVTAIWMLLSMYVSMYLQFRIATKCFVTHITAIWTHPSMYTLQSLHNALLPKSFIRSSLSKQKRRELYYYIQKMYQREWNWSIGHFNNYHITRLAFPIKFIMHYKCRIFNVCTCTTYPICYHKSTSEWCLMKDISHLSFENLN
jgi:hypothetical protein